MNASEVSTCPTTPSVPASPFEPSREAFRFATECVNVEDPDRKDQYNASSVPIYQSATFKGVAQEFDYSRSGNPTRSHLEHHLCKISGSKHAFAVSSGMAAFDVITRVLKPGDEVVSGDDLYGGTQRLLSFLQLNSGIIIHHANTTNLDDMARCFSDKTRMIHLETPTNPLLRICDIRAIVKLARKMAPNAMIVVDNTMMSPYLSRPLDYGVDIVYDSGTKYLSGHHDLMAGVMVCNSDVLAKQMYSIINTIGNGLVPFDSFLLLRGCKTLAIRMDKQQSNAQIIAEFLNDLGLITHYPGLPNHPDRDIHYGQATGAGAVLSFQTGSIHLSEKVVGSARLFSISVSFGAVNSLISMPCVMSHASIPSALRAERGLPEDLIRLCVGIEDPEDLLNDLEMAMQEAGVISRKSIMQSTTNRASNWRLCAQSMNLKLATLPAKASEKIATRTFESIMVSAPAKIILFGEHAVVYGEPALAAALNLRCYALLRPRSDHLIELNVPDAEFSMKWPVDDLPWYLVPSKTDAVPTSLDESLLLAIQALIPKTEVNSDHGPSAAATFLYLLMVLATSREGVTLTARSAVPMGAGLGSSASYSVCVTSALLYHYKHMSLPSQLKGEQDIINTVQSAQVDAWSFLGEKIIHGNPSGIDNCIAARGGAVCFMRATDTTPALMDKIQCVPLRFLLTDSKIPRNTKKMVAGVAAKKQENPAVIGDILKEIGLITEDATSHMRNAVQNSTDLTAEFGKLIDANDKHLVSLGVSHEKLAKIKSVTDKYSLHTKLTGGGGGGCTITLLPEGFDTTSVKAELESEGFDCYVTTVGGPGFGVADECAMICDEEFGASAKDNLAAGVKWTYV